MKSYLGAYNIQSKSVIRVDHGVHGTRKNRGSVLGTNGLVGMETGAIVGRMETKGWSNQN